MNLSQIIQLFGAQRNNIDRQLSDLDLRQIVMANIGERLQKPQEFDAAPFFILVTDRVGNQAARVYMRFHKHGRFLFVLSHLPRTLPEESRVQGRQKQGPLAQQIGFPLCPSNFIRETLGLLKIESRQLRGVHALLLADLGRIHFLPIGLDEGSRAFQLTLDEVQQILATRGEAFIVFRFFLFCFDFEQIEVHFLGFYLAFAADSLEVVFV